MCVERVEQGAQDTAPWAVKERKKDNRYIKVHIGTLRYFLSISYRDVLIRVLLFTYFKLYFVYVVCTVHGTQ